MDMMDSRRPGCQAAKLPGYQFADGQLEIAIKIRILALAASLSRHIARHIPPRPLTSDWYLDNNRGYLPFIKTNTLESL